MKKLFTAFSIVCLCCINIAYGGSYLAGNDNANTPDPGKGTINGYDWVDLGLSVMWATHNVGASTPEGYGEYYAWGEITTKAFYDNDSCLTYDYYEQSINSCEYDVAYVRWGYPWRMPNKDHIMELVEECTWTWITLNNVSGCIVTGPSGNSIFLPAGGFYENENLKGLGEWGSYWSSTNFFRDYSARAAYELEFEKDSHDRFLIGRCLGLLVRPVVYIE